MRALIVIALLFLSGCAQVAQDVKENTYDDAIEAVRRNHDTRFQWRAECRILVTQEVAMWSRQATVAENEGELEKASEYRAKAAHVLTRNFPDLITVQSIKSARESINEGEADVFSLDCFPAE